jgi:tryptophanyl-tRNA synthetase
MAVQYPCEICHEHVNEIELICINGKLMCSCCIKQHIACLEAKIENLEENLAKALDNCR